MGSYNSQYESYYSNLVNRRKNNRSNGYNSNRSSTGFRLDRNFILRRLTQDLIGVFILFIFVITCKMVVTTQTTAAYNFSKVTVNKNYDFRSAVKTFENFNFKAIEDSVTGWLESIKVKITGTETIKDKIKENYVLPIDGAITSHYGDRTDPIDGGTEKHEGVDIYAVEGTNVICPYDGVVKECGEDGQLGKYILINHGDGIETKYGHLSEIDVKVGDTLKKEQVIGKSGSTGKSTGPHLHFEILNMGENEDPEEYLNFSKN